VSAERKCDEEARMQRKAAVACARKGAPRAEGADTQASQAVNERECTATKPIHDAATSQPEKSC